MVNLRRVAEKLAVENEPGLSNAQLMLVNEDLKPGATCCSHTTPFVDFCSRTAEETMGSMEFRWLLDCRLIQYCMSMFP